MIRSMNLLPEEDRTWKPDEKFGKPSDVLHTPEGESDFSVLHDSDATPQNAVAPDRVDSFVSELPASSAPPLPSPPLPSPPAPPVSPIVPVDMPHKERLHIPEKGSVNHEEDMHDVNLAPEDLVGHHLLYQRLWDMVPNLLLGVITVAGLFLVLTGYETRVVSESSRVVAEAQNIQDKIHTLEPVRQKAKALSARLNIVHQVIDQHIVWTPLFSFLEETALPGVTYSALNADAQGVVTIQASASSLSLLLQQYQTLKQDPRVRVATIKEFLTTFDTKGDQSHVSATVRLDMDTSVFHETVEKASTATDIPLQRPSP